MNQHPLWPTWPFTKLTPEAMAKLLRDIEQHNRNTAKEALL